MAQTRNPMGFPFCFRVASSFFVQATRGRKTLWYHGECVCIEYASGKRILTVEIVHFVLFGRTMYFSWWWVMFKDVIFSISLLASESNSSRSTVFTFIHSFMNNIRPHTNDPGTTPFGLQPKFTLHHLSHECIAGILRRFLIIMQVLPFVV